MRVYDIGISIDMRNPSTKKKKKFFFDKYFWCIIVGQTSEELFKENSILIMIEQIYKPVYVSYY